MRPGALRAMTADEQTRPGFSLRRWSQRKHAAKRAPAPAATPESAPAAPVATASSPSESVLPAAPGAAAPAAASVQAAPLPPVDALSFDSDFTAYLQPTVDESLKRQALKKLFADPRFNVMDGLDVYIDDYSKPDPLPPGMLEQLVQGRYLFDPPKTRVNEQGVVEDVPPDEVAATGAASAAAEPAPVAVDAVPSDAAPPAVPESSSPPSRDDSKPR